jgi:hypothetical protein
MGPNVSVSVRVAAMMGSWWLAGGAGGRSDIDQILS